MQNAGTVEYRSTRMEDTKIGLQAIEKGKKRKIKEREKGREAVEFIIAAALNLLRHKFSLKGKKSIPTT